MKKLIILRGLPRSGKTTWAREMAKQTGAAIVNPDSIRLAIHGQAYREETEPLVWATAQIMADSLFRAGHEIVIIDATNVTEARRKFWYDRFKNVKIEFITIMVPVEECIERAKKDGREYLIPVIERMAKEWED